MNKIFIIWHDYDGTIIKEFDNQSDAEDTLSDLLGKCGDNGLMVDQIILGRNLKYKATEVVKKAKLEGGLIL